MANTPTEYRVNIAAPHEVDRVWPLVADGMEDACRKTGGAISSSWLWGECRSGRAFLVIVHSDEIASASVWEFQDWSSGHKLKCHALYGKQMADWMPQLRPFIEELAEVGKASAVVWDGRMGWQKLFPNARVIRQTYEAQI